MKLTLILLLAVFGMSCNDNSTDNNTKIETAWVHIENISDSTALITVMGNNSLDQWIVSKSYVVTDSMTFKYVK